MRHGACAACGRTLPPEPWMMEICSEACVDRFVDALAAPAPASAPTPPATGLARFLAEA